MREARRIAAAGSGSEVALATTADGLVAGPTPDVSAHHRRAEPADRRRRRCRVVAAAGRGRQPALHHGRCRRRARCAPDVIVHSVFDERRERGDHGARRAAGARRTGSGGDAYLEIANFAQSPQAVHAHADPRNGDRSSSGSSISPPARRCARSIPLSRGTDAALRAHVDAPHNALRDGRRRVRVDRARAAAVGDGGGRGDELAAAAVRGRSRRPRAIRRSGGLCRGGRPRRRSRAGRSRRSRRSSIAGRRATPPAIPAILIRAAGRHAVAPARAARRRPPRRRRSRSRGGRRSARIPIAARRRSADVDHRQRAAPTVRRRSCRWRSPRAGTPLVYVGESRRAARMVVRRVRPSRIEPGVGAGVSGADGQRAWTGWSGARRAASRPAGLPSFSSAIDAGAGPGRRSRAARAHQRRRRRLPARRRASTSSRKGASRSTFAVNIGDPQTLERRPHHADRHAAGTAVVAVLAARPWWAYCVGARVRRWRWRSGGRGSGGSRYDAVRSRTDMASPGPPRRRCGCLLAVPLVWLALRGRADQLQPAPAAAAGGAPLAAARRARARAGAPGDHDEIPPRQSIVYAVDVSYSVSAPRRSKRPRRRSTRSSARFVPAHSRIVAFGATRGGAAGHRGAAPAGAAGRAPPSRTRRRPAGHRPRSGARCGAGRARAGLRSAHRPVQRRAADRRRYRRRASCGWRGAHSRVGGAAGAARRWATPGWTASSCRSASPAGATFVATVGVGSQRDGAVLVELRVGRRR